ncbi:MAG TPA: sigma-70 family RNA polymerase sigma factor [Microlunatus sp.]
MPVSAEISPPTTDEHVHDPAESRTNGYGDGGQHDPFPDQVADLTVRHLWLADSISRRFQHRGQELDDLRQVARCGLLEAARRYDADKGAFAPFAASTISGVLKRHFRDHAWTVRPPRRTQQIALEITRQWSDIAQECGHRPDDSALAAGIGQSVADIREARRASQGYRAVSIEAEVLPAATATSDGGYDRCEARILVAQAWRLLEPSEQDLLRMRYWESRSQADIAEQIGVSQMQVSRLLSRILNKIRELLDIEAGRATA